ncbi:endolytic transglycosylase MltG [Nocardioides bruguierae]|uniref:Endolytic murein transglycosylase n=1 Tax=Nocardioides bruguierae TaxID=2945102 RepID=A0A9X2DAE8_9ACTN|nr:endolytic transglycosylase MltG [Nocardioides bruguierae]MCM0622111.1 endolytic transglycosylase MltG [Nocardioides bruguierae]
MSDHDRDPAVGPEPTGGAIGGLFSEPAEEPTEERTGQSEAAPAASAYDPGGRRRRRKSRLPGYLAVIVVLALVGVGGYYGVQKGTEFLRSLTYTPEDYDGPGRGRVLVEVGEGETATDICRVLADEDVVASVDACIAAANVNEDAAGIQVGYYELAKQMSAADAIDVLVDPANLVGSTVTIPEGSRVRDIVKAVASNSNFTRKQLNRLLASPQKIGLPAEADGNPEGYLFPATYTITPDTTAKSLVTDMVAQTTAVEQELGIAAKAEALGLTPHEIITVASILEYEANNKGDYAKVATVIYNRLDLGMALQMDSTVSYVSGREGDVWTTAEEREDDSLYNTYKYSGLPPGPIGSPGRVSMRAALNPKEGDWLYFVPDFETGKTLFAATYSEHLANVAKAKEYCQSSDAC